MRSDAPIWRITMATATAPATALDYLRSVANGSTKADGLKRPTVAAVNQAAKALGLRAEVRTGYGQSPWQVGFGFETAPCQNLAQAAKALVAEAQAQATIKAAQALTKAQALSPSFDSVPFGPSPLQACFASAPARSVAPGPLARKAAPARLPAESAALLASFGLSLDSLFTAGVGNAKIAKGAAEAYGLILHHLPAKALAQAVAGAKPGSTAPRSRIDGLAELAQREGVYSLALAHNGCPWASKGCSTGCLAWSGHGGMGVLPAAARARRTLAFLKNSQAYSVAILWAIARAWAKAQAKGLPLAVRLRGTDDLSWNVERFSLQPAEAKALAHRYGLPVIPGQGQTLADALQVAMAEGSLKLYDYSKAGVGGPLGLIAQRAAGWDVTASLAADRPGGAEAAIAAIAAGFRLAVPVALAKGAALPKVLILKRGPGAPDWLLQCIDGDQSDNRWLDPQGPQGGFDGVAVILRTKASRGKGAAADAFSLAPSFGQWQPLAGGGQALLGL
jgi:hypothetical protein